MYILLNHKQPTVDFTSIKCSHHWALYDIGLCCNDMTRMTKLNKLVMAECTNAFLLLPFSKYVLIYIISHAPTNCAWKIETCSIYKRERRRGLRAVAQHPEFFGQEKIRAVTTVNSGSTSFGEFLGRSSETRPANDRSRTIAPVFRSQAVREQIYYPITNSNF